MAGDLNGETDHVVDGLSFVKEIGVSCSNGQTVPPQTMRLALFKRGHIWSKMNDSQKKLWGEEAKKGWAVYVDNNALKVLTMKESAKICRELARRGELDESLSLDLFVLTSVMDFGQPLIRCPSKRHRKWRRPGFRGRTNLGGTLIR